METDTEVNNVFLPYHTVTKQQNLVKNKRRNKGLVFLLYFAKKDQKNG